jgi:hypothetical protein
MRFLRSFAVVALFSVCLAGSTLAETPTFSFDPPDSIEYRSTTRVERVRYIDGNPTSVDSTTTNSVHRVVRDGAIFEMMYQPVSILSFRNGSQIRNSILTAMSDTEFTYRVDSTGKALSVEGHNDVLAKVYEAAPEMLQNAGAKLDPEQMAQRDQAEWNLRFEPLIGKPVVLGAVAWQSVPNLLPDGTALTSYVVISVADTFRVDGQLCGRVNYRMDSDAERLSSELEIPVDEFRANFPGASDPGITTGGRMKGAIQLVIEVATGLEHAERVESVIEMPVKGQNEDTHQLSVSEIQVKEYDYGGDR